MIWFVMLLVQEPLNSNAQVSLQPKVVNGYPVEDIEDFGHSVYFGLLGIEQEMCGGSILNERIVLTAAHCIRASFAPEAFYIRVGNTHGQVGFGYRVVKTRVHEKYHRYTFENDIGLVLVDQDIFLGRNVYRVTLSKIPPHVGILGTVAAWGIKHWWDPKLQSDSLYITQKIIPNSTCQRLVGRKMRPNTSFCAGNMYAKSYWRGDSGSALMVDGQLQVGIMSGGYSRGISVYTDVSQFYDWIQRHSKRLMCTYYPPMSSYPH